MNHEFDHGRRLSQREYEVAIADLHSHPTAAKNDRDAYVRRRELDITIDFRLGINFPASRRDDLWRVQQSIEERRLKSTAMWIVGALTPKRLFTGANGVAKFVVDQYATVLTAEELRAYFGSEEVRYPSLPFDH